MRMAFAVLAVVLFAQQSGAADGNPVVIDTGGHFRDFAPAELTPDGKRLVTLGNGALRVWDAANGKLLRTLWLPAGALAQSHTARFWLAPNGELAAVPFHTSEEPRGKLALVPLDDSGTYRVIGGDTFHVQYLAFSADGKHVATSGGTTPANVWDVATGKHRCAIQFDPDLRASGFAFSPDGKTLAVGLPLVNFHQFKKSGIGLYDAATGKWQSQFAFARDGMPQPEWSPDGKLIAVHSNGGSIDVHEPNGTPKLALARAFHPGARRAAAGFDATGRFLTVTHTDTGLRVRDELAGRAVCEVRAAAANDWRVQLGANGTRLLARDAFALRVFDTAGRELSKFSIGSDGYRSFAWSKTGSVLAWSAGRWTSPRDKAPLTGAFDFAALNRPAELPPLTFRGALEWDGVKLERTDYSAQVLANGKTVKLAYEAEYDFETISAGALVGPKHAVLGTATGLLGYDTATGAETTRYKPFTYAHLLAPRADGKAFASAFGPDPVFTLFKPGASDPVAYLLPHGTSDWLAWTPGGAWASSAGGAHLAGRLRDRGPGKLPTFVPFEAKLKDAEKVKAAVR